MDRFPLPGMGDSHAMRTRSDRSLFVVAVAVAGDCDQQAAPRLRPARARGEGVQRRRARRARWRDAPREAATGSPIGPTKTPFSPNTVVQIGSNTKDFTVVALLQLHERGKLNIHDSLAKFFPNAPADKRNITLWQLVNARRRLSDRTRRRLRADDARQFVEGGVRAAAASSRRARASSTRTPATRCSPPSSRR